MRMTVAGPKSAKGVAPACLPATYRPRLGYAGGSPGAPNVFKAAREGRNITLTSDGFRLSATVS